MDRRGKGELAEIRFNLVYNEDTEIFFPITLLAKFRQKYDIK